jgi:hypothetical protein
MRLEFVYWEVNRRVETLVQMIGMAHLRDPSIIRRRSCITLALFIAKVLSFRRRKLSFSHLAARCSFLLLDDLISLQYGHSCV